MSQASVRPGIWGHLEQEISARPQPPEGDGRLWQQLADRADITRFRPKLADYVEIKDFKLKWGNDYAMIANNRDLIHYRLTPEEADLVRLMDGTRTVKDLVVERFQESGDLELGIVADLVQSLYVGNFLTRGFVDVEGAVERSIANISVARQKGREFARTLSVEWSNADKLVRWFYRNGLKYFFRAWLSVPVGLIGVAGFVAFLSIVRSDKFSLSGDSLALGFLLLLVLNYVLTFAHELGHALVIVHRERKIKGAGFMIYFGSPAFFVEASDAQMMERKDRILQAFAGPYAEIIIAGIASIIAWAFPDTAVAQLLYKFAVLNYIVIFFNLIPLLELDGYWILSDLIQVPDLRPRSLAFIRHDLWHKLRIRERFSRTELGLGLYGVLGILFTIFSFYSAYFFWEEVFGGLVRRMWHGGTVPRVLLILLLAIVGGPVVRGLINAGRAVARRVSALWQRLRFRFETKWRVEAAELVDRMQMFDDLPADVLSDLAGRVRLRTFARGQPVVRQGDRADAFYIVRDGVLQVVEEDPEKGTERVLRTLARGESFGELGLVQGTPRAATVRALDEAALFEVDKGTFDRLLADHIHLPEFAPTLQVVADLRELPSFSHLEMDQLFELLEHGEWVSFSPGDEIIRQGEVGDAFYAIRSGQVDVVKDGETVNTLGSGAYFGEVALLLDVPRTATIVAKTPVRAYRLDREGFDRLVASAFKRGALNPQMPQERTATH